MTTNSDKKSNSRSAWPHVRKSNKNNFLEQKSHYTPSPDSPGHYGAYNLLLIINKAPFKKKKIMLFLKGMKRDFHGYPTLRHIELIAEKRQQLPPQCCISPHTDEQQCIHFALLFFLCWRHHNSGPESPKGILELLQLLKRIVFLYLLKDSLLVLKEPGAKGPGCIATCSLLPPISHHSVCTVWKNRHKNNLRSGKDEIRHRDARKEIFPCGLKEMLKTSSKGKVWKISTGFSFFYPNLIFH